MVVFVVLVGWISIPALTPPSSEAFHTFRWFLAVAVVLYAAWVIYRLTTEVAFPMKLEKNFVPELVAYAFFWVLAPTIWFFVEYYAVKSGRIMGEDAKAIKALLLALIAFAEKEKPPAANP
jgi:hypothetical protein